MSESKELPYRVCVRVWIVDDGRALMCRRVNDDGSFKHWDVPGGGVEDDDMPTAVIRECLEEVGVGVGDLEDLGLVFRRDYDRGYGNAERAAQFRGPEDHWWMARRIVDRSELYNREGDGMRWVWMRVDDALELLEALGGPDVAQERVEALRVVKERLGAPGSFRERVSGDVAVRKWL